MLGQQLVDMMIDVHDARSRLVLFEERTHFEALLQEVDLFVVKAGSLGFEVAGSRELPDGFADAIAVNR